MFLVKKQFKEEATKTMIGIGKFMQYLKKNNYLIDSKTARQQDSNMKHR